MPQSILSSLASRSMAARALGFLGALAVCGSVQAGTVTLQYQDAGSVWGPAGQVNGHIQTPLTIHYPTGNVISAGGAGAFAMQDTTHTLGDALGNFVAFCADLAHYIRNPAGEHETGGITDLGFSDYRIYAVEALFDTAYTGVLAVLTDDTPDSNNLIAGFQMALWELLYEPYIELVPSQSWDVTAGGFSVASTGDISGATGKANALLAALDDDRTGSYALTFLKSTTIGPDGKPSQNLVTATAIPAPVPLPAAGLLLLVGLAGLGAVARRRKNA